MMIVTIVFKVLQHWVMIGRWTECSHEISLGDFISLYEPSTNGVVRCAK